VPFPPGAAYPDPRAGQAADPRAGLPADPISQLERLAAMHTAGQLTNVEFEEAKRKILGR
jgi:hypothetical protein